MLQYKILKREEAEVNYKIFVHRILYKDEVPYSAEKNITADKI